MPLVFSPSRILRPESSLSRPSAFARRVLSAGFHRRAGILSFPSDVSLYSLHSLSSLAWGTSHTQTLGKSAAHRYLIISIGPSFVFLKTTRFAHESRPSPHLIFFPATFQFVLFHYFYLSARRHVGRYSR